MSAYVIVNVDGGFTYGEVRTPGSGLIDYGLGRARTREGKESRLAGRVRCLRSLLSQCSGRDLPVGAGEVPLLPRPQDC